MTRIRRIKGRQWVDVDGVRYRIELRADGLHVRKKHARQVSILSMHDLIMHSVGQLALKL